MWCVRPRALTLASYRRQRSLVACLGSDGWRTWLLDGCSGVRALWVSKMTGHNLLHAAFTRSCVAAILLSQHAVRDRSSSLLAWMTTGGRGTQRPLASQP